MKEARDNLYSGIGFLLFGIFVFAGSYWIPATTSDVLGSRFFPRAVSVLMVLLAVVQMGGTWKMAGRPEGRAAGKAAQKPELTGHAEQPQKPELTGHAEQPQKPELTGHAEQPQKPELTGHAERSQQPEPSMPENAAGFRFNRPLILTVAALFAYYILVLYIGFTITSILYLLAQSAILMSKDALGNRKTVAVMVLVSVIAPIFIHMVFWKVFSIALPAGKLF